MIFCICHIPRSYGENILEKFNLLAIYSESHLKPSNSISKWAQLHSKRFFEQAKTNSRVADKFKFFFSHSQPFNILLAI